MNSRLCFKITIITIQSMSDHAPNIGINFANMHQCLLFCFDSGQFIDVYAAGGGLEGPSSVRSVRIGMCQGGWVYAPCWLGII